MTTITLEGTRFGTISYEEQDRIHFPNGLIGFESYKDYLLVNRNEKSPFRWLQSLDEPSLAFLLAPPENYVEGYAPELSAEAPRFLGGTSNDPFLVYSMAVIPNGKPQEMRLNLAAPVVIHPGTKLGLQAVVDDPAYTVRYHVFGEPATVNKKAA